MKQDYESHQITPCPVEFEDIGSYVELLRLLSMGVLFGEGEQLRRIGKLIAYLRGRDVIVEELLYPFIPDGKQIDDLQHFDLYDHLIGSAWEEKVSDSQKRMTQFLNSWYKFYEGAPWHNAHMRIGENEELPDWANYYGYFAWEAGAIAYLYELDDSAYRDHILYPKDLVDWACKQGPVPKTYTASIAANATGLSARAGEVCPESGEWFSIHLGGEKRYIQAGEIMPGPERSQTGEVIWYLNRV